MNAITNQFRNYKLDLTKINYPNSIRNDLYKNYLLGINAKKRQEGGTKYNCGIFAEHFLITL